MAGEISYTIPSLVTVGPEYAQEINTALAAIMTHNHDGVDAGASIDIAAQVCNEDLSLEAHNLTNVRSVAFDNQPSALTGSQDVNCIYVNQENLGFNNNDGIFVPITYRQYARNNHVSANEFHGAERDGYRQRKHPVYGYV